ncbi:MAG TPA: hypothetical protein DDX14_06085, partial [Cyanobacteria bacterium UBA9579]|nr:hypothetical protein [Cyanobacteria bacterium UBA9579]
MYMSINIKEAFTYFLKEKSLLYKLGTFTILIYLFGGFLSDAYSGIYTYILSIIIFSLALCGYLSQLSNNLINKNEEILLDLINLIKKRWDIITLGLQFSCILLCYLFPVYIAWINIAHKIIHTVGYVIPNNFHLGILTVVLTCSTIMGVIAITAFSEKFKFFDSFKIMKILKVFKYAYKEYLLLFLILINFAMIMYIPMTGILRIQITIMFFILNVILDSIILLVSRNKDVLGMIKRWFLIILIFFASILYQHVIMGLLVSHLMFIMLTIITAPIILILQHLFYQAYMIG